MAKESSSYNLSEEVNLTSYIPNGGGSEGITINVRQLVAEIQLYESINHHVLTGFMTLVDAASVLDDLPLTGHEILSFKLHTPGFSPSETKYPKGYDFVKNPMFVYKINSITKPNPGVKMYTLEFCSKEEIRNSQRKLSKAYHDRIDNSVRLILRTSLGSPKDLHFEKTALKPKYVMPKMSPFAAIKFLAGESIGLKSKNAGYHFYETSTGFHFKSLQAMFHTGKAYKQPVMDYFDSPKTDSKQMYKSKDGAVGNLSKVLKFTILNRYDSNVVNENYKRTMDWINGYTEKVNKMGPVQVNTREVSGSQFQYMNMEDIGMKSKQDVESAMALNESYMEGLRSIANDKRVKKETRADAVEQINIANQN